MVKTIKKTSSLRRKQRKNLYTANMHERQKGVSAHLSKELSDKVGKRSAPVRKGDKVKIMRGDDRGSIGKVEDVDLKRARVLVEGITQSKANGSKVQKPLKPSNLMIIELAPGGDKRRFPAKENETNKEVA